SSCSAGAGKMTTYSISLRHIKIHPMVQTELIPHRTRQGWNLVLQVRMEKSQLQKNAKTAKKR
ncbi:MAG: hypothetical protein IJM24_02380, partial [Clostridia bacterium]|nr:hypothetical protein [Clostridia bacterium]